jgi:hypothetical protein
MQSKFLRARFISSVAADAPSENRIWLDNPPLQINEKRRIGDYKNIPDENILLFFICYLVANALKTMVNTEHCHANENAPGRPLQLGVFPPCFGADL